MQRGRGVRRGMRTAASPRRGGARGQDRRLPGRPVLAADREQRARRGPGLDVMSAGLVGELERTTGHGVGRRILVTDELGGAFAAARLARQARGGLGVDARAARRRRGSRAVGRTGRARRHRSAPRGTMPRGAGGVRPGPWRSRAGARRAARSGSSWPAARRWAATSRPWRWSARCMDSKSASCSGVSRARRSSARPGRSRGRRRGAPPGAPSSPTSPHAQRPRSRLARPSMSGPRNVPPLTKRMMTKPRNTSGMTLAYWSSASSHPVGHRGRHDALHDRPAVERRDGDEVEDEEHDVEVEEQEEDAEGQVEQRRLAEVK